MFENILELLAGCKTGNEEMWRLLFMQCYPIARRLVKSRLRTLDAYSVDLLAQDAMLALHRRIHSINDAEHLGNFLRAAVRNKCVDYIRRNKLPLVQIPDDLFLIEEKTLLTDTIRNAIYTALGNLGEQAASIIRLRYLESLSYREIAVKTGIDEAQVGMKLSRALKSMKKNLAQLGVVSCNIG